MNVLRSAAGSSWQARAAAAALRLAVRSTGTSEVAVEGVVENGGRDERTATAGTGGGRSLWRCIKHRRDRMCTCQELESTLWRGFTSTHISSRALYVQCIQFNPHFAHPVENDVPAQLS